MKHLLNLVLLLLLFSCSRFSENPKHNNKPEAKIINTPLNDKNSINDLPFIYEIELDSLLQKFDLKGNMIDNEGWYYHKEKQHKSMTHIEVPVCSNGYFYLKANYCGNEWLFFEQIIVKIGNKTYYSNKEQDYNTRHKVTELSKNIFNSLRQESFHMTSLNDKHMAYLIANNLDKPISIRFKGVKKDKDITLSSKDKQIIYDSYVLSQLISVNKNKDVQSIPFNKDKPEEFYISATNKFPTNNIKMTL